jgi:hypothetical protein
MGQEALTADPRGSGVVSHFRFSDLYRERGGAASRIERDLEPAARSCAGPSQVAGQGWMPRDIRLMSLADDSGTRLVNQNEAQYLQFEGGG